MSEPAHGPSYAELQRDLAALIEGNAALQRKLDNASANAKHLIEKNAKLKRHAEAMAKELEWFDPAEHGTAADAVAAYRADFPKEET